jgi:hypothetical protein
MTSETEGPPPEPVEETPSGSAPAARADSIKDLDTDDLEDELAVRKRKKRGHARTWQYILASSLAGFIAGFGPHFYQWLDTQTAKTKATITAELMAAEKIANDEAYKEVTKVLRAHAEDITSTKKDLTRITELRIKLAVLEEWRANVDNYLRREHHRRLRSPDAETIAGKLQIETHPPDPKPVAEAPAKRPEVGKEDPRVQKVMDQMYQRVE